MTKFEQIGINYQHNARSIADANKSFEYSCNCCCNKGMHLDCDRCAISAVHNMVVACFEHLNGKENKVSA